MTLLDPQSVKSEELLARNEEGEETGSGENAKENAKENKNASVCCLFGGIINLVNNATRHCVEQ